MGNRFLFIGSALLPALFFACASSTGGTTTTTGTPTDLASSLAAGFCEVEATCAGTTGPTLDAAVTGATDAGTTTTGTPVSTCLDRAKLAANQQLALVNTSFGEGLLTINATVEAACVSTYKTTLACATLGSVPDVQAALDQPACGGLFIGYIPVGERCDMSAECVSGSFCRSQGTGQPATAIAGSGTLGVCFAYVPMDGACNTTDDCLPPLVCNPTALICG